MNKHGVIYRRFERMLRPGNPDLKRLTPRQQAILFLRFGISEATGEREFPPMTLQEIGEIFSVSRERIRQIEGEAIVKLRPLIDPLVEDPLVGPSKKIYPFCPR